MGLEEKTLGELMEKPEESRSQRDYISPRIVEWGSITDLTQGPLLGSKDFPVGGGTRPT
jgi:hypothetical protein